MQDVQRRDATLLVKLLFNHVQSDITHCPCTARVLLKLRTQAFPLETIPSNVRQLRHDLKVNSFAQRHLSGFLTCIGQEALEIYDRLAFDDETTEPCNEMLGALIPQTTREI